jgi:23S rRNA (guanosine2251-2'-O)-methyltransferase
MRPHKPNKSPPKDRKSKPPHGKPPHGKPPHSQNRAPGQNRAPRPENSRERQGKKQENWIYGLHAIEAALANPRRNLHRAVLTARAAEALGPKLAGRVRVEPADIEAIARLLPPGAVHQGAALSCDPLPTRDLDEVLASSMAGLDPADQSEKKTRRIVLVLDQLSDPHNVGAILRTAAAFAVTAVVVQDRHAPPQSGALTKAASGAMEIVPYVEVVNVARALDKLGEAGFWRIALVGDGQEPIAQAAAQGDIALVVGSEGDGIRRLVREHCDTAAFIPIDKAMESLNVSNAAAIALYEIRRT